MNVLLCCAKFLIINLYFSYFTNIDTKPTNNDLKADRIAFFNPKIDEKNIQTYINIITKFFIKKIELGDVYYAQLKQFSNKDIDIKSFQIQKYLSCIQYIIDILYLQFMCLKKDFFLNPKSIEENIKNEKFSSYFKQKNENDVKYCYLQISIYEIIILLEKLDLNSVYNILTYIYNDNAYENSPMNFKNICYNQIYYFSSFNHLIQQFLLLKNRLKLFYIDIYIDTSVNFLAVKYDQNHLDLEDVLKCIINFVNVKESLNKNFLHYKKLNPNFILVNFIINRSYSNFENFNPSTNLQKKIILRGKVKFELLLNHIYDVINKFMEFFFKLSKNQILYEEYITEIKKLSLSSLVNAINNIKPRSNDFCINKRSLLNDKKEYIYIYKC